MKYHRRRSRRTSGAINGRNFFGMLLIGFIMICVAGLKSPNTAAINFLSNNLYIISTILAVSLLCATMVGIIILINIILNRRYRRFANEHSMAVLRLKSLNMKYEFKEFTCHKLTYTYDNEIFFDQISPYDYLVYQLVYLKKDVLKGAQIAKENELLYASYLEEVSKIAKFQLFNTDVKAIFKNKLFKIEKKIFADLQKRPQTKYQIPVSLVLTKINGAFVDEKTYTFNIGDIKTAIDRINNKYGDRYLDEGVWQSICKVERGKVSNKLRFLIYKRDNYRCRKCGQRTNDLEVDHIFPISKGGKSNYENLQTLCHRCNALKSNTVEFGAVDPKSKRSGNSRSCPECGAPLSLKKGKYGDFYGCSNYPRCTFTEKL